LPSAESGGASMKMLIMRGKAGCYEG